MKERDNILRIFQETKEAIKKGDSAKIKGLSDQTINTASLTHDPDNIAVAVIVYSLSKILERKEYKKLPGWERFYKAYIKAIDKIISALKKDDEKKVRENLKLIRKEIGKLSGKLKKYIQDVFTKAKINKASKIYEHGISMEKTASLLGITMFDLAQYAGQKEEISEQREAKTMEVRERIKLAMEMFK
ncbi:hypothetical protein DRN69_02110 [Candidatus Pacearchaeota archaeon]|nr:MAG: hypothetical protein DRN69_02110 [Candidatus Pacearchaeota archaeon]